MASPWVNLLSNEPGGGLNAAMKANNALANENVLRQINQIKKQYLPTTLGADAASKLAYANLMGPQFLAKLLSNNGAIANMGDPAAKMALQKAVAAGMGQGSGMNAFNQTQQGQGLPSGIGQPSTNSLSRWFANTLKNAFGHNQAQNSGSGYDNNANPGVSAEGPGPIDSGSPFVGRQGYKAPPASQRRPKDGVMLEGEQWYDKNGHPVYGEEVREPGAPTINLELTEGQRPKTYAEKTGEYEGVVQEGQDLGKIRAKDIEGLNNAVFNAETNQATLDEVANILASPTFEKIRQVPLAGQHELSYYAKEGNKEEQQMVGKYYTLTGNLIKDASRDFAGQFRKGEQQLLNGMKPGPSDTVDSAKGKTETLSVLNKMLAARSRLTSKIMSQYHVNKLEAMEEADRQVNGEQIRKEVHDRLNPTVTIRNRKTGETKTISAAEARKLGVPNV